MATNGHTNGTSQPKITLYTNHGCPYAHRAHITLAELGLKPEEVIIDLEVPRPRWYLDINPRGLVPSIKLDINGQEQILTESAIVSQFLADAYGDEKNALLPKGTSVEAALKRARINFFIDTWSTKVGSQWFGVMRADDPNEKDEKVDEWVAMVKKEIEPLLQGAGPYFLGSKDLTLAEVIAAPFLLRWYSAAEDGEMMPASLIKKLEALPNFAKWSKAVRDHPSVTEIYDGEKFVSTLKKRMAAMKAKA